MKNLFTLFTILFAGQQAAPAQQTAVTASASASIDHAANRVTSEQKGWLARGHRHDKHGWVYLHIEGTPRERGFQHGYLLAAEIREALRKTKIVWEYRSGMDWSWLVEKSKKAVAEVDAENLAEIDGMVEGLRAAHVSSSRQEMIAYNATCELFGYWWPKEKERLQGDSKTPPRQSCSAFIATGSMTKDGDVVLGHNTMDGYYDADCNAIIDIQPDKGHRILMQAPPGWIHSGTDFFITDAGLVGAETTIGAFKGFDEKGVPEFSRMRRAMQDADTIDRWCEIMLKGNNGGYANAWLLGDINTKEIALFELGLKYSHIEKKKDGYFSGSNLVENMKLLRLETSEPETDIRRSSVARKVRWKQLMAKYAGKIDLELAKAFEADHYDAYLQKDEPGGRSICGHFDLDAKALGVDVPFEPEGTLDAKVVDTALARRMSFAARWGSACGMPFDADKFLIAHPQFDWTRDILKNRPSQPWTEFRAGE
jgi:hypothetical protein